MLQSCCIQNVQWWGRGDCLWISPNSVPPHRQPPHPPVVFTPQYNAMIKYWLESTKCITPGKFLRCPTWVHLAYTLNTIISATVHITKIALTVKWLANCEIIKRHLFKLIASMSPEKTVGGGRWPLPARWKWKPSVSQVPHQLGWGRRWEHTLEFEKVRNKMRQRAHRYWVTLDNFVHLQNSWKCCHALR
jgi:hypothetical protein